MRSAAYPPIVPSVDAHILWLAVELDVYLLTQRSAEQQTRIHLRGGLLEIADETLIVAKQHQTLILPPEHATARSSNVPTDSEQIAALEYQPDPQQRRIRPELVNAHAQRAADPQDA